MRKMYTTEAERKAQRAAYHREWRRNNPEKFKASRVLGEAQRARNYYLHHQQKIELYKKQHRADNKDRYNSLARDRYDPIADRAKAVKRLYGITLEQVEQMCIEQQDRCKTCLRPFIKTPHVDHCHVSGKVRGLLCGPCNRALGLVRENITTLTNMISLLTSTTQI